MITDLVNLVTTIAVVGLTIYLLYALIQPEKF